MAQDAEEDQSHDGATISQTGPARLAECTTIARDRKSWRKLEFCGIQLSAMKME